MDRLVESLAQEQKDLLAAGLKGLAPVFPFNEYEFTLMFLLDRQVLAFERYEKLRAEYIAGSPYLELFGSGPRVFGDIWAHERIRGLDNRFLKPDRSLGPDCDRGDRRLPSSPVSADHLRDIPEHA